MALGLFRVCLVVVTAIVNHPLLFPRENATVPENDQEIIRKMQAHEEKMQLERLRLEEEEARMAAEKEAPEQVAEEGQQQQETLALNLWTTLCMILFLIIEVWRQDHHDGPLPECPGGDEDELPVLGSAPLRGVTLPSQAMLGHFQGWHPPAAAREHLGDPGFSLSEAYSEHSRVLSCLHFVGQSWKVVWFVPVQSENRPAKARPVSISLHPSPAHLHPPGGAVPRQGYGQVKVGRADGDPLGCICGKTKLGEDMLCLLHAKQSGVQPCREMEDLLCAPESPYLDTMRVMKWFQTALTKAWQRIAHKFDFDLAFGQLDTPGSLKIMFRSGKAIPFNLIPVIQSDNSDLHFVSHLPRELSGETPASSTDWLLSFAVYEQHFLRITSKGLPEGACHLSCLQIASFLLSKQSGMEGACGLGASGLSTYHLKTSLMHLLLSRKASDWKAEQLHSRLQELLCFLEKSLLEKKLLHFFVGNRKVPEALGLPEAVRRAEPLNLFRPFVLQRGLYRRTVDSFYKMLENAPTLVSEYSLRVPSSQASLSTKAVIL
uniref:Inositol 1,4,5-trisphosphate receptor-interacting protein n=1 Tax=Spermophilus dauricus TaxID=99837 RepID=A0A8C9QKR2_SPEDA